LNLLAGPMAKVNALMAEPSRVMPMEAQV